MAVMTARRIRHIPVIEDGALCGIVSIGDVVKWRVEEIEREAEALRAYVAQA
jgi:CBS domain-containing protein